MTWRWLFGFGILPCVCGGQVTGAFSIDKAVFARAEPVYLTLSLRNEGKEAVEIETADPYTFCSGYRIRMTRDGVPASGCSRGSWGSCVSFAVSLAPGASRTERVLLNYENEARGELYVPVKLAGAYTVEAFRDIAYGSQGRVSAKPQHTEVRKVLHVRVDEDVSLPPAAYSGLLLELGSKEEAKRREAALALATLAPPALEDVLLGFATSKDWVVKQQAPLALASLNTKASIAALAAMLLHPEPANYEFAMAANFLGKTHDPAWLPLLLEVADQHEGMYLRDASESGGGAAIPALLARMRSGDAKVRAAAVSALGQTGSRAAIPILIGMLGGGGAGGDGAEGGLAEYAEAALRELTHIYWAPEAGVDARLQGRWQTWWFRSGAAAEVYRSGDCAAYTELP